MPDHGPQFDEFHRQPAHGHNGSEFDAGFTTQPGGSAGKHGALYDEFESMARVDKYGDTWDEFGWRPMPAKHGQQFDSDFSQPAALGNGEHGTWQDIFRGGTQVRYMHNGKDLEGVVLNAGADHLLVAPRSSKRNGGGRHELALGQIKEWRYAEAGGPSSPAPSMAHPGDTPGPLTASTAHAPSAHDAKAHGGGRTTIDPSVASGSTVANKTIGDDLDVAKASPACGHCGLKTLSPISKPDSRATSMGATSHCTTCGTMHGPGGKMLGGGGQKTWWSPRKGTQTASKDAKPALDVEKTLAGLRAYAEAMG